MTLFLIVFMHMIAACITKIHIVFNMPVFYCMLLFCRVLFYSVTLVSGLWIGWRWCSSERCQVRKLGWSLTQTYFTLYVRCWFLIHCRVAVHNIHRCIMLTVLVPSRYNINRLGWVHMTLIMLFHNSEWFNRAENGGSGFGTGGGGRTWISVPSRGEWQHSVAR